MQEPCFAVLDQLYWCASQPSTVLVYTDASGRLVISETRQTDEGSYACYAENIVGRRSSAPAILAVLVRPFFVRLPDDVEGRVGGEARLHCRAGGSPAPHVTWRRHDGRMPVGRARLVDEDHALTIVALQTSDDGEYFCQAENEVATVVARARLTVLDFPRVISVASDEAVIANTTIELPCHGAGTPTPTSLWTLPGRPQPVGVGEVFKDPSGARLIEVLPSGSLRLTAPEEGQHTCMLVNTAGGIRAHSWLTVVPEHLLPPPLLSRIPPLTLTLPAGTSTTLPCQARGPPEVKVRWFRGNIPVHPVPPRVALTLHGDLIFSALQESDSAEYVCEASSSSGSSRARCALLVVGGAESHRVSPHQTPHPPTLKDVPGAPTRPRVINVTTAGVTLTWSAPSHEGNRPLIGYRVSCFTAGWPTDKKPDVDSHRALSALKFHDVVSAQRGWVPIHKPVIEPFIYIELIKAHPRLVVVQAFNALGDSEPSPWSPLLIAADEGPSPRVRTERAKPLSGTLVNLTAVTPLPMDALRITWRVTEEGRQVEGVYVHYRPRRVLHLTSPTGDLGPVVDSLSSSVISRDHFKGVSNRGLLNHSTAFDTNSSMKSNQSWSTVTVMNAFASSYVLSRLSANTEYEVFLAPFSDTETGQPTALLTNITFENAPSGPPLEVSVQLWNLSAALLSWRPPDPRLCNGVIISYQIEVVINGSMVMMNRSLDASLHSFELSRLSPGQSYSIMLAAATRGGVGPSSPTLHLQTDPALLNPLVNRRTETQGVVTEVWFIMLVGGAMFFLLLISVVLLYIKRYYTTRSATKLPRLNGSVTKTSNLANFYGGENLWPDSSNWKPTEEDSGGSGGNQKSMEGSKTFMQLRSPSCKSPFSTNLLPSPVDPGSAEDALLASLSPEYAEIDSLGTFGNTRRCANGSSSTGDLLEKNSSSGAEAYASASILSSCKNVRVKALPTMRNGQRTKLSGDSSRIMQDGHPVSDISGKQLTNSNGPYFIEHSIHGLPSSQTHMNLTFVSSAYVGQATQFRGSVPTASACSTGRLVGYPASISYAPVGQQLPGRDACLSATSPYSVNTFTSQPHLLKQGLALNLRDMVAPPPPSHPPPTNGFGARAEGFNRTKTMDELPYACYSSTQVVTPPAITRAASLEGGGSPYSSCTYQSIEGLTHTFASIPECQRLYQCGHCGVESSASSVTSNYARPRRCNHGTFVPRPSRRSRRYIPDYYGWVSPSHSPPYQHQQVINLEPNSASASVYGGSVRSDPGGISQNSDVIDAPEHSDPNSRHSILSLYSTANDVTTKNCQNVEAVLSPSDDDSGVNKSQVVVSRTVEVISPVCDDEKNINDGQSPQVTDPMPLPNVRDDTGKVNSPAEKKAPYFGACDDHTKL
ncbi:Fibronectin type III [Trinorchestia longiramus]|nr:Fibronectin type III [Trinorchestia longiramus]